MILFSKISKYVMIVFSESENDPREGRASGSSMRPFRPPADENGGEAANVW